MGRRSKIVLAIGAVMICALMFQRGRLQRAVTGWLICRENAPAALAMQGMVEQSDDPVAALKRLWGTHKIVQREFVLDYLRYRMMNGPSALWPSARPLALEGASCGDVDTQQAALTVLEECDDPQAVPVALSMLGDVDPNVRRDAMMYLDRRHDKRLAPVFVRMLDDPNDDVRGFAAGGLEDISKKDFGRHFNLNEAAARAARAAWKQWWAGEQTQLGPIDLPAAPPYTVHPVGPSIDFALQDLSGKTVRLSDFRGKLVLITFWATWCPPCLAEVPSLVALHQRHGDGIIILAISADGVRQDHEHAAATGAGSDAASIVKRFAADNKLPYRILLDPQGQAMGAYSGGDLPVGIWVDRAGLVRRRFIGPRPVNVLENMARAIDPGMEPVGSAQ